MNTKLILTLVTALAAAPVAAGEWQTVSADAKGDGPSAIGQHSDGGRRGSSEGGA